MVDLAVAGYVSRFALESLYFSRRATARSRRCDHTPMTGAAAGQDPDGVTHTGKDVVGQQGGKECERKGKEDSLARNWGFRG